MSATQAEVFPTKRMTDDVSSRDAAVAWAKRRIKKLTMVFIVAVALAPVASAIVVGWKFFRRSGGQAPPIGPLITSSLMWSVIAIACMGVVFVLIGAKYMKFAKRAAPIIESGTETAGTVTQAEPSSRRGGGVTHYKMTVIVQGPDGTPITAAIEETEGTDIPEVDVGAPAVVWSQGGRSIVATSGALFESV